MTKALILLGATAALTAALAVPAGSDVPPPPPTEKVVIAPQQTCDDVKLSIYFPAHEAMMSSYALRTISAAGERLEGCAVTEINTNVVSEESHTDEALADLSRARAEAVLQALQTNGIYSPETSTDYTNVSIDPRGAAAPMARRVEVQVKATPGYGL